MLRKSKSTRNSVDDGEVQSKSEWMWESSQSLAMSLMDNDMLAQQEKRPSISETGGQATSSRKVYRLVDRESKFRQAKYPIFVRRVLPINEVFKLFYANDPVLALTNLSTFKGFIVMLLFFIVSCAITALPWYAMGRNEYYREDCSVETTGFQRAFIFSSQVIMTIGFGTKDIFFGSCILPTVVLTFHCGVSLLVQSIIMGIIYQRLSRATSRRHTVICSDNAIIRRIRGKLYFMIQVCELRAIQLVELHVRLYVIRHESMDEYDRSSPPSQRFQAPPSYIDKASSGRDILYTQTYAMRLSQPNDDLGSKLLLSTPQIIVHEIDDHSPLRPPAEWREERPTGTDLPPRAMMRPSIAFGEQLKATSSDFNNMPESIDIESKLDETRSTSRTYHKSDGTFPVNNYQFPDILLHKERVNNASNKTEYAGPNPDTAEEIQMKHMEEKKSIETFLEDKNAEVVVVLEGVDPMTSHNVQSYHSYVSDEIKWDHSFVRCCSVVDGWTTVDFTNFHNLQKVPTDQEFANAPSHN